MPSKAKCPNSLPLVVMQPDKRLQTELFCVASDMIGAEHNGTKREDSLLFNVVEIVNKIMESIKRTPSHQPC